MGDRPRPSVGDALAIVRDRVALLEEEAIHPSVALDRVLSRPVIALCNAPRFRAAAMDGYACRAAEIEGGLPIALTGEGGAGLWPPALPANSAARISTGAPVPEGADCVVARERASILDGRVSARGSCPPGLNIREAGEDLAAGTILLGPGRAIGPEAVATLIMAGLDEVWVRRRPTLAIIPTGSELGGEGAANIPDSNGPMIAASAARLNLVVERHAPVADAEDQLAEALDRTASADLIVTTGGVSVGDHDLTRAVVEQRGGRILFHGVAMRPGKPMLFATLPDGRPLFGLPGNPVAALVGFRFFVGAAVRGMLGLPEELGAAVATAQPGREGTTVFLRAARRIMDDGTLMIDTDLDQRSHVLSSLLNADSWLRVTDTGQGPDTRLFQKDATLFDA